jgi:hypothetical protein
MNPTVMERVMITETTPARLLLAAVEVYSGGLLILLLAFFFLGPQLQLFADIGNQLLSGPPG